MERKCYSELIRLSDYLERYRYLRMDGDIGKRTFGSNRYLNQVFYRTDPDWKQARRDAIIRDNGMDLGINGRPIGNYIVVHHIVPITDADILYRRPILFDPENLICVGRKTHEAIHYGDESLLVADPIVRTPGDTCPWR
jgi:hypothetical protein